MHSKLPLAILLAGLPVLLSAQVRPRAVVPQPAFGFERVLAGVIVETDFVLRNEGDQPLRLIKADMTPPLRPTKLARIIQPGQQATLTFRLDTTRLAGPYEGEIILDTDDPAHPEIHLTFQGEVTPLIEFRPQPMFFVSTVRGQQSSASIEIINHQPAPLEIASVQSSSTRFTTRLETLEPGQRYRLTLSLAGDGSAGRRTEPVILHTSSERYPRLQIAANTLVKERIYTFPDSVEFGAIPFATPSTRPVQVPQSMQQTLMVYRADGVPLHLSAATDLPFISLSAEPSDDGSQYQIDVQLSPADAPPGPFRGYIIITTNDQELTRIEVPISGAIPEMPKRPPDSPEQPLLP